MDAFSRIILDKFLYFAFDRSDADGWNKRVCRKQTGIELIYEEFEYVVKNNEVNHRFTYSEFFDRTLDNMTSDVIYYGVQKNLIMKDSYIFGILFKDWYVFVQADSIEFYKNFQDFEEKLNEIFPTRKSRR